MIKKQIFLKAHAAEQWLRDSTSSRRTWVKLPKWQQPGLHFHFKEVWEIQYVISYSGTVQNFL